MPVAMRMPSTARCRCSAIVSYVVTVMPPRASVAAIPGPIVPRPTTAAFVMSSLAL
jgi:hypothetical protein